MLLLDRDPWFDSRARPARETFVTFSGGVRIVPCTSQSHGNDGESRASLVQASDVEPNPSAPWIAHLCVDRHRAGSPTARPRRPFSRPRRPVFRPPATGFPQSRVSVWRSRRLRPPTRPI